MVLTEARRHGELAVFWVWAINVCYFCRKSATLQSWGGEIQSLLRKESYHF